MVQHNTGKFLIIFANILVTIISLGFAYVAFILARINDTIGTYELTIMIAATLTVMASWLLIFLYFKKGMKNILYIFFIAGLICIGLMFFNQGLSVLIPGAFYLIGSILIFNSKEKITDDLAIAQLHNNWKLTFIFVGNILNTFVWVFFCYIFLLLIGNHEVLAQLLNTNFNESFTIFLIISTLIFITLNWVIYFVIKLRDIQNMYFYFLFVSVINIGLGVYNIFVLNGGSFPPPEKLLLFIFEAPVFLFIFPGLLYIVGFIMREKEVVYTEKNIK